jgi:hypothetical protein
MESKNMHNILNKKVVDKPEEYCFFGFAPLLILAAFREL